MLVLSISHILSLFRSDSISIETMLGVCRKQCAKLPKIHVIIFIVPGFRHSKNQLKTIPTEWKQRFPFENRMWARRLINMFQFLLSKKLHRKKNGIAKIGSKKREFSMYWGIRNSSKNQKFYDYSTFLFSTLCRQWRLFIYI